MKQFCNVADDDHAVKLTTFQPKRQGFESPQPIYFPTRKRPVDRNPIPESDSPCRLILLGGKNKISKKKMEFAEPSVFQL